VQRNSGFFVDRPGIIYLTETVCLSVHASSDVAGSLWAGIRDLPPRMGCDLLAIGGDVRPTRTSSILHYQIAPSAADGFLAWRSRSGEDCRDFFRRFDDSPLVYISTAHSDKSVETIANAPGIVAIIAHLVQQHGCRKIAYLSGPEHHNYAKQRHQAYLDSLAAAGLPFDASLVTPHAPWEQDSGMQAVHILLDERQLRPGIDIDALVCSSDQVALGALQALRQRGIRVPEDLKLTGFNNVRETRTMIPSMTTVAMPFQQQSRRALLQLLHEMGLANPPGGCQPQAYMVKGESCGCGNDHLARLYGLEMPTNQNETNSTGPETGLRALLFDYLQQMLRQDEAQAEAETILAALRQALDSGALTPLLTQIKPYVRTGYFGLTSQAFWANFWGACRTSLTTELTEIEPLRRIHLHLDALSAATADIYLREEGSVSLWNTKVANALRSLSVESNLVPDMEALLHLLESELQALEFHSCWLVCYDIPIISNTRLPSDARLVLALEEGQRNLLSADGVTFPVKQIIPPGYRRGREAGAFIGFPVMQREYEYGYIILNHSRSTDWGEMISDLVGSAIRSIRLRQELAQRTTQLEHSYQDLVGAQKRLVEADKMAALGELVAGVAHEINTPVGVGVTAVSTLMDETRTLSDLVERRQAGPIPGVVRNLQESAAIAMRNLERAAQLIESFKQIAVDQTRSEVRTINLAGYLEDVVRSVAPRLKPRGHQVEIICPKSIEIACDPSIIARIFTNLIINSLLHGFEGQREGLITIECAREVNSITIDYRDNGHGMDVATLDKMFHPFFTTKRGRGGTGLGMHIVYNLVTKGLGGQIRAESEPGAGVRFLIHLPTPLENASI
jgi:signal transduction histidine kinase/DNA-binding LacI/PurR family transcriptional regulator